MDPQVTGNLPCRQDLKLDPRSQPGLVRMWGIVGTFSFDCKSQKKKETKKRKETSAIRVNVATRPQYILRPINQSRAAVPFHAGERHKAHSHIGGRARQSTLSAVPHTSARNPSACTSAQSTFTLECLREHHCLQLPSHFITRMAHAGLWHLHNLFTNKTNNFHAPGGQLLFFSFFFLF